MNVHERHLLRNCALAAFAVLANQYGTMRAQTPAVHGRAASQAKVHTSSAAVPAANSLTSTSGIAVDQVVAVVNGELVLESDINADRRFAAFNPLGDPAEKADRDEEVERLVNRELIIEQAKLQPDSAPTKEELDGQIDALRKEIPQCKRLNCESEAGWQQFLKDHDYTAEELRSSVAQQMQVLKFVELRFRTGIQIPEADVADYYKQKLLPEYARQHATAPKLEVLRSRIEGILLEQQVSSLLSDWLTSLKAQGSVQIMRPRGVQQ